MCFEAFQFLKEKKTGRDIIEVYGKEKVGPKNFHCLKY